MSDGFTEWLARKQEGMRCWCAKCRPVTMEDMRMVVCPKCGDKRCIHAADHEAPCALNDIYAHNAWVEGKLNAIR